MNRVITVFVNGARVEVADDATVMDAVRTWSDEHALAVEQGGRIITDSRGLPIPPGSRVHGGAIFRLVVARDRDADSEPDLSG